MSPAIDTRFLALQELLLGRYSLERELGRGGMGTVYLARDVVLDRPVAIKVLHAGLAAQPEARARFLHEARTAARLAHPHIIPIFAVEEHRDAVFFVMAVIDGETLGQRIRRRGPMHPDDAGRVLRETAWALGYAHSHGVIHRDLTLENILVERGTERAVLADFGIATERDMPDARQLFGTPAYLAPEVIRGEPASVASDLYALGCVAFAALTGRTPFIADTPGELLAKQLVQEPPSLAPLAPGASRRLVAAVESCLAKDPDARPADTGALLAVLERAPEPVAIAPPLRSWFTRWERIKPVYALAAPLLAVQSWALIDGYFSSGVSGLMVAALINAALTVTVIPLAIQVVFERIELRRLRRYGFGIADIRAAFPHWHAERTAARRREAMPSLVGRVVTDLTVVGAVTILGSVLLAFPLLHLLTPREALFYNVRTLIDMLSYVYLGTLIGVGIGMLVPGYRPRPDGRLARVMKEFWNSRGAEWLVRLAQFRQQGTLTAGSTLHRNTELVLGLAVDDLWKVIPEPTREALGDVPALAHSLQRSAAELRDLIARLEESERDLAAQGESVPDLAPLAARLGAQYKEAITALEQLRLQLLRLLATREHTVELTRLLTTARGLDSQLQRAVAGHATVNRILGRSGRGMIAHASAPTPTPA